MTDYIVSDQNLSAVASAIRSKADIQGGLSFPAGFVDAVNSIETGGGGGHEAEDALIDRTLSGNYVNNRVKTIGDNAFRSASFLTGVDCEEVLYIHSAAFANCSSLKSVSFPKCLKINSTAFGYCSGLSEAEFPECSIVETGAFSYCSELRRISLPKCSTFSSMAFYSCKSLETIYAPKVKEVGYQCFFMCSNLREINFPECIGISGSAFVNASYLQMVSFPKALAISSYAFQYCYRLLSCYFLGNSVPTLPSTNVFSNTPISTSTSYTQGERGTIYVRASLVESFANATGWKAYSSRIVGLTDEEIAALNEGE